MRCKMLFVLIALFFNLTVFGQKFSQREESLIRNGDLNSKMEVLLISDSFSLDILKKTSDEIDLNDPLLPVLKDRMLKTVTHPIYDGVGIAAPQVGINKRLIWVQRFDKINEPFEFYINPKIIWYSNLKQLGPEGCLSIPDVRGDVIRSYVIQLSYYTIDGAHHIENIEDFTAVIFQHEYDHLLGILFPERIKEQELLPYKLVEKDKKQFYLKP